MKKKIVWLPYDFDTAIGINNEGSLVFGYELEDTDHLEGGADVFNGQESVVWKNVRDAFQNELAEMYKNLRSTGALSYAKVERMFEEHQGKWSEAIFNEDSWFKYIDPLVNDGTGSYLPMMQGSKAEQRKWWLYNRFRYIDSKYNAGDALNDLIQIRGYAKADVTVTPYADIYPTVKYGSYLVSQRGSRGASTTLICPLDNVNDTEIYIYSASQLASVGDLSGFKVGFADFSMGTKLQDIKIGDADPNYENTNLNSLTLGNNILLKTLDVRNCSALGTGSQKSVDISGCTNIEEVYFDGTAIQGVSLPDGGVLRKLHLPSTITNLTIKNQRALSELVIPSLSNLSTLRLENNSDLIDVKAIAEAVPANTRVRLIGFYWEAEDADEIADWLDVLDTMRGLDENGNNVETAQLSGEIHTTELTGAQVADYNSRYPYLRVTADSVTSTLTYMSYDGVTVLKAVTCYNGVPQEAGPSVPSRAEDAHYVYTPVGWSTTYESDTADPYPDENVIADRVLYPAYSRVVKTYTATFARAAEDGGGTLYVQSNIPYGTVPTFYGPDPTTTRGTEEEYIFKGWIPELTGIVANTTYTARFKSTASITRQLITSVITDAESSDAERIGDYAFHSRLALSSASFPEATSVGFVAFYGCTALTSVELPKVTNIGDDAFSTCRSLVSASIPKATSLGIRAFYNCSKLASLSMPEVISIDEYAFAGCAGLTTLVAPNVISIGLYAFQNCAFTTVEFKKVTSIGEASFTSNAKLVSASFPEATNVPNSMFLSCTALTSVELPKATSVGRSAFYGCKALTSVELPKVTSIGQGAFSDCISLTSLILSVNQVVTLGAGAFANADALIIYVPDDLVDDYKTATNWSTYADRIKGISELPA